MLLAALTAFAVTAVPTAAAAEGSSPPGGEGTAGPPYPYVTELVGQFGTPVPLKDQAMLTVTDYGYLYRAGQQNSHVTVTRTEDGLLLADTGTERFKRVSPRCEKQKVERGVAALCPVPKRVSAEKPLLLEIWPRLGHDFVDVSSLSEEFATTVLGDKGRETVRFGAGWDFFNGFTGRDRIWGGGGNDWVRSGIGPDVVHGDAGDDQLVGVEGADTFYGGDGDDRLGGGPGDDVLDGGPGADFILCDLGEDTVLGTLLDQLLDRLLGCRD